MAETRSCSRTGCNRPAAASLSFRYETRQVWVTTLQARSGTRYDLCGEHADTLTVPRGWHRKEERPRTPRRAPKAVVEQAPAKAPAPSPAPAAAPEPAVAGAPEEGGAPVPQPAGRAAPHVPADRYARLLSELPRLAQGAPHEGAQLAIPVADRPSPDAVVVSMAELAGARRRSTRESLRG